MERSGIKGRIVDWLWLALWGVASTVWCVTAAGQLGATFDEPDDLARGLDWWRTGTHHQLLKSGTMPLPIDLDALPLYLWERWQGVRFDLTGPDLDRVLPVARAGTLPFWWLLLVSGWRAGRHLAGPWGGRLAVAMLACEPCLLAHASLATKDIAVTACLLALIGHFDRARERGWKHRVGGTSLWFAAAVLSKASALPFAMLCLFVVEVRRLVQHGALGSRMPDSLAEGVRWLRHVWGEFRPFRRDLLQVVTAGLVLVLVYCGSDWCPDKSFVAWTHQLPAGAPRWVLGGVAEHLAIFPNALEALVKQVLHNIRGHGVYLLGETDSRAFWYYFPVALSMKVSVPLMVLPLLLAVVRPRALGNWACLAAAGLLVYSLNCRVQIGIRFMLPLVALAVVGMAAALVQAALSTRCGWQRWVCLGGGSAAVLWTTLAVALVWPHALCYTNELWGGTANGYRCLSDSNYDWGQGLKELARWRQQHGLPTMGVWYFGSDPAVECAGFHKVPLHGLSPTGDILAQVRGQYVAVSTTLLYGCWEAKSSNVTSAPSAAQRVLAFLHTRQPVDRTTTFFIYNFTEDKHPPHGAADSDPTGGEPLGHAVAGVVRPLRPE